VHNEDTSNAAFKKSSVNPNLATNEQSAGPFGPQVSPVLFLILLFLLGAVIFLGRVLAMFLRLPCATRAGESVVRNACVGL
jgi:hypothetical protein